MAELITIERPIALPAPRVPIAVRVATADDLPFVDSLQKKASKAVGFMPTKQLEGKIVAGQVLVADAVGGGSEVVGRGEMPFLRPPTHDSRPTPAGYLIGQDRYFKRDDVGIIYAINVVPEARRSLVAATLLRAQFERSAYGCRLYCCWCAQDLAANRFWEALGFVPLAFRTGSAAKARTHVFWQKRIRSGDETTPWWFPSQTTDGSIREDRLVLPIPPGTHWGDAKPIVLPGEVGRRETGDERPEKRAARRASSSSASSLASPVSRLPSSPSRPLLGAVKFRFASALPAAAPAAVEKPKREKRPKAKNDPTHVAMARELRDRWLEQVNADGFVLASGAKYLVGRTIADRDAALRVTVAQRESLALPAPLAA